jgi:predicted Holliday junction resolvase-like endonuclease
MDSLMTIWVFFIGCCIGILIGVILSYRTAVSPMRHTVEQMTNQDQQFHEKMKYYPFNIERFRFIGKPVDGIQFEEDSILFVCLTEANTPLTSEQVRIKTLLENGNVQWFEFITK